ncbi:hypothetical protein HZS_1551 [Henneguya salminicola]|nr:hypothetical protein HZS_1551 [Henneguya salminicola]
MDEQKEVKNPFRMSPTTRESNNICNWDVKGIKSSEINTKKNKTFYNSILKINPHNLGNLSRQSHLIAHTSKYSREI